MERRGENPLVSEHRWSKFWWADYEADDALRLCSLAAQGLWMRMLCAMHRGTPYGHLTVNGAAPTPRQLALMLTATQREIDRLVPELQKSGVMSVTEQGLIYSRRMVRDKAIIDKGIKDGRTGGNPFLRARGLTPPLNPKPSDPLNLDADADAEAEEEEESPPPVAPPKASAPRSASPTPAGRGCRIADDWTPADPGFAAEHGVDQAAALAEFRDYWRGVAGKAGVKIDWEATWRNQVRHLAAKPKPKLHTLPPAEQDRRILAAVGLRFDDPPPIVQPPLRIAR